MSDSNKAANQAVRLDEEETVGLVEKQQPVSASATTTTASVETTGEGVLVKFGRSACHGMQKRVTYSVFVLFVLLPVIWAVVRQSATGRTRLRPADGVPP